MGRLEINYFITEKDRQQINGYLEKRGEDVQQEAESTTGFAEGYFLGQLGEAWKGALENLKSGNPFGIRVDKQSLTAFELSNRGISMRSEEAELIERRHWTAKVPGATDLVDIRVFGKDLVGFGDHPMTVQLDFDTGGCSDRLFLSKQGTFHREPEGISVTTREENEREDYHTVMLETTCGALHIWQDVLGGLQEFSRGITAVRFEDSSEFELSMTPDVAVEIGRDKRGIDEKVLLEQVEKIIDNSELAQP